ncbi:hypothetical protein [Enterovibrio paralichthyis]|uniref:hypothetical protein n=1 Tax=Enterovibrio paralichthyis TaxID=2853805 RepID=UPI001C4595FC|nr:hypothetical protein [Enterovibrio paralichthyis]MBV7300223.1 hypothetical protein [Enterovibrio paralichthyis]
MSLIIVRKNARKQIKQALMNAAGILKRTAHSRVDDSYDYIYQVVSVDDVLQWLDNEDNYADAKVRYLDNEFIVSGPYYFDDKFIAYPDQATFEGEKKHLVGAD